MRHRGATRDAYSRERGGGSQSPCYRIVTNRVLLALPSPGAPELQALETDERAGADELGEFAAIGQAEAVWHQFGQGVQHEGAGVHVVMRYLQARHVDQLVAEQQDIQVERARAPTLLAHAALVIFDGLQGVEQGQWLDPKYLESLRERATKLTLEDGQKVTVALRVIGGA